MERHGISFAELVSIYPSSCANRVRDFYIFCDRRIRFSIESYNGKRDFYLRRRNYKTSITPSGSK